MLERVAARMDAKKFSAGLIYVAIGVGGFVWARDYPVGSATRMGPGYFPAMLSVILTFLGLLSIVQGIISKTPSKIEFHRLQPLVLILLSIVSFGFVIDHFGLIPAIFVAVVFACLQRVVTHPIEVMFTFAALAAFCSIVFVHLFSLPVPLVSWRI